MFPYFSGKFHVKEDITDKLGCKIKKIILSNSLEAFEH